MLMLVEIERFVNWRTEPRASVRK